MNGLEMYQPSQSLLNFLAPRYAEMAESEYTQLPMIAERTITRRSIVSDPTGNVTPVPWSIIVRVALDDSSCGVLGNTLTKQISGRNQKCHGVQEEYNSMFNVVSRFCMRWLGCFQLKGTLLAEPPQVSDAQALTEASGKRCRERRSLPRNARSATDGFKISGRLRSRALRYDFSVSRVRCASAGRFCSHIELQVEWNRSP